MVSFLATLVTYPFMFLMAQGAAAAGAARISGVQGGVIDTRKRLTDFPEGRALANLERWVVEAGRVGFGGGWATEGNWSAFTGIHRQGAHLHAGWRCWLDIRQLAGVQLHSRAP